MGSLDTCPPYLDQGGLWDLHKFKELFWRSRVGVADSAWTWRYTVYLLWTGHENAFVHCSLYMHIWLLGALPPDWYRGCAPEPRWRTSVPQTQYVHLTSKPWLRQWRQVKPRPLSMHLNNSVKFGRVVYGMCEWTNIYKQTNRQTHQSQNFVPSSRGEAIKTLSVTAKNKNYKPKQPYRRAYTRRQHTS